MPVPTSLAAGTYPLSASYGASADFAGSSGTGQLVVAASSTGSGSPPGGSSGGGTSGQPGTTRGSGVAGPYQTPQQLLAIAAAGVALQNKDALEALHQQALTQLARDELLKALHNLKGGSSLAQGLAGATSGSTHAQAAGPGVRSGSGGGGTGTGNASSSDDPATVNLVASQSKPTSPAMTVWFLGLLVLAFGVVAMVMLRRHALRVRALVASAADDEGAE